MSVDQLGAGIGTELRHRALARGLGISDCIECELHRIGIERGAVVEADIASKLQRHALAVRCDIPRRRKAGQQTVRSVAGDQRIEDLCDHLVLMARAGDPGIVGARGRVVLAPGHREPAAGLRGGAPGNQRRGQHAAKDRATCQA